MSQPSVAIVILNYNGKNHLAEFLPSVFTTTYNNRRIIVADNASTDDSVAFVKAQFPEVELILLEKNYGYAGGYNEALKQVNADYFVLLNSDVEVTSGWIEPIIALMEIDKNIAACQPKILSYWQKNMFEYAGACGGWVDSFGYPFARGRMLDVCEEDKGQYDNVAEVFWASGAAIFMRAEAFKKAGGFDDSFFAHMEEIDLCFRLKRMGYKICCCPQSVVYHLGGGTLPKGNYRKVFLNFKNSLLMMHKNLAAKERSYKFFIKCILDFAFAFKSLLSKDANSFKAVFNAYIFYMKWLLSGKSKKDSLLRVEMKKLTGVYHGSLAWQYFIKKKRTFTQIAEK